MQRSTNKSAQPITRVCPACGGEGSTDHRDGDRVRCATCHGEGDVRLTRELAEHLDAHGFDRDDVDECRCGVLRLGDQDCCETTHADHAVRA